MQIRMTSSWLASQSDNPQAWLAKYSVIRQHEYLQTTQDSFGKWMKIRNYDEGARTKEKLLPSSGPGDKI